jgi:hypothetical protein
LITQTIAGDLIPQLWETDIEYDVNNVRGVAPLTLDTGSKYFGTGKTVNWPRVPSLPSANVKTNYPTVTYADPSTTVNVTATPTVVYTGLILQEDVLLTTMSDASQIYSPLLGEGLYQKLDADILALHGSFTPTTVTDAAGWTEPNWALALERLLESGGDKVQIGGISAVYDVTQWGNIMTTGNAVSAAYRGESNGAAKTGMLDTIYGVKFLFTANVTGTDPASNNMIFAKKAIWIARKNRPKVEMERTDLTLKILASHMYSVQILNAKLGIKHVTTTS